MQVIASWTGARADALRQAMRMSNGSFAVHLGVSVRTVANWRKWPDMIPQLDKQAILDTALDRAPDRVKAHFAVLVSEASSDPADDDAFPAPPNAVMASLDAVGPDPDEQARVRGVLRVAQRQPQVGGEVASAGGPAADGVQVRWLPGCRRRRAPGRSRRPGRFRPPAAGAAWWISPGVPVSAREPWVDAGGGAPLVQRPRPIGGHLDIQPPEPASQPEASTRRARLTGDVPFAALAAESRGQAREPDFGRRRRNSRSPPGKPLQRDQRQQRLIRIPAQHRTLDSASPSSTPFIPQACRQTRQAVARWPREWAASPRSPALTVVLAVLPTYSPFKH
jgi:hypothetical protein